MNHQGGAGQFNYNAGQNEVNPRESVGALGLFGSSSTNNRSAGFLHGDIDLNLEYEGNNPFNPDEPETQNASNSSDPIVVIDSGIAAYVVEEQGARDSSPDVRRLSCKRRSPENALRELSIGESSRVAEEAGIPKRRAAVNQGSPSYSLNISAAPYTGPAISQAEQFEAGIGHGIRGPVSGIQRFLSEARQTESFQSNINLQTAANPQDFISPSILSMGYPRHSQVQLPIPPPYFYQYDHPHFLRSAEIPFGAISSVQPFGHIPNFPETIHASPWINTMRPRNIPASFWPHYTVTGDDAVPSFHDSRNIMVGPQAGGENWVHNAANLFLTNGTPNFPGNVAYPSGYGPVSGTHLSNAPAWVPASGYGHISGAHLSNAPAWIPGFSFAQQYVRTTTDIVNHSAAAFIGSRRQSSHSPLDLDPSRVSLEMESSNRFANAISQSQQMSVARAENRAAGNPEPRFTLWSAASAQSRNRLLTEVRNALEILRNGGSLQLEDVMRLDYSVILYMIVVDRHVDLRLDIDDMQYEELLALEEQIGDVSTGLSEEAILMHLKQEKFLCITEGTPANESCCICQEDYADGEDIGKLDCEHKFHFACIKQWLVLKNTCPICKCTALAVPPVADHDD